MLAQRCKPIISEFWPKLICLIEQQIKLVLNVYSPRLSDNSDAARVNILSAYYVPSYQYNGFEKYLNFKQLTS